VCEKELEETGEEKERMRKILVLASACLMLAAAPAFAATITVTTDATSGAGSLPDAIANANAGDTIVFDNDYTIVGMASQIIEIDNLTIDGEDNTIVFDNEDTVSYSFLMRNCEGVTLRNLEFVNGASAFIHVRANNCTLDGLTCSGPMTRYGTPISLGGGNSPDPLEGTVIQNCSLSAIPEVRGEAGSGNDDGRQSSAISFAFGYKVNDTTITNCAIGPCGEAGVRTDQWWYTPYGSGGGYNAVETDGEGNAIAWRDGITITDCRFYGNNPWANEAWGTFGFDGDATFFGWCDNVTISGNTFGTLEPSDLPRENIEAGNLNDWETTADGDPENVIASTSRVKWNMGGRNLLVEDNVFGNGFLGIRIQPYEPEVDHLQARRNIVHDYVYDNGSYAYIWSKSGGWSSDVCTNCSGPHDFNYEPAPAITSVTDDAVMGTSSAGATIDVYVDEPTTSWYGPLDDGSLLAPQAKMYVGTTVADGSGNWTLDTNAKAEMDDLLTNYEGWFCTAQATGDDTQPDNDGNTSDYGATYITATPDPNDTDGDSLPNDWEEANDLDPNNPAGGEGADGDPDEDGFTNRQEFEGGSDPQDPDSVPMMPVGSALLVVLALGGAALAVRRFA
jgi:hypothetical protein